MFSRHVQARANMDNHAAAAYNDSYLAVFKIHGDGIDLWNKDRAIINFNHTHSIRIRCRNVETTNLAARSKEMQMIVLSEPASYKRECKFQNQHDNGQIINKSDLIVFTTSSVIDGFRKSTYAIDFNLSKKIINSLEDNLDKEEFDGDNCEKIGTALIHLDPKFSTQGVQRAQIITTGATNIQIGQIQVEYLIVTDPIAFGKPSARPNWLYTTQLDAGHRGTGSGRRMDLPEELLENTIASFNYAHRHGADMCELDVMMSADGIPVVFHNYDIDLVAAQQSKQELEKFQVGDFTVEQMGDFRLLSLRDEVGSPYFLDMADQTSSNKPFQTLEQVLAGVDKSCALNVELKCPQMLQNGKREAAHFREINDYVERVLSCIAKFSNGRNILFSTFNPDVAILLRLKQTNYPVLFLTTGDRMRFSDISTKSVMNAIHFAQAFDLAGINANAAHLTGELVRYAQGRGQLVYAWGKIVSAKAVEELKRTGLDGVIYDKIDLIKPHEV